MRRKVVLPFTGTGSRLGACLCRFLGCSSNIIGSVFISWIGDASVSSLFWFDVGDMAHLSVVCVDWGKVDSCLADNIVDDGFSSDVLFVKAMFTDCVLMAGEHADSAPVLNCIWIGANLCVIRLWRKSVSVSAFFHVPPLCTNNLDD